MLSGNAKITIGVIVGVVIFAAIGDYLNDNRYIKSEISLAINECRSIYQDTLLDTQKPIDESVELICDKLFIVEGIYYPPKR